MFSDIKRGRRCAQGRGTGADRGRLLTDTATLAQVGTDLQCSKGKVGYMVVSIGHYCSAIGAECSLQNQ